MTASGLPLSQKINNALTRFGPAFFIIGYVVGTGSVTSMVISGAQYGLRLSWALFLSCFFTYFLIIAISKLTIVSGHTLMYNFRRHFGAPVTIFIMVALLVSIVSSIIGIMGVASEVVMEWIIELSGGALRPGKLTIALFFIALLLVLFWAGKHPTFLKIMTVLVSLMALSFVATSLVVIFSPEVSTAAMVVEKPRLDNPALVIAGLVGTTMAAVVLVSRSILVEEEGWKLIDLKRENQDARLSMILTFLISLAIMVCAAGTLYVRDIGVENAIDMMRALEPFAGEFAMSLFAIGVIAAGLSSIFPNLLLFPWLLSDYSNTPRNFNRPLFQAIVVLVALSGITIPLLGGKPIWILIASQALSPFVMPLITLFLLLLLNREDIMKKHRIGWPMSAALVATLLFNCYMVYVAFDGFFDYFQQ